MFWAAYLQLGGILVFYFNSLIIINKLLFDEELVFTMYLSLLKNLPHWWFANKQIVKIINIYIAKTKIHVNTWLFRTNKNYSCSNHTLKVFKLKLTPFNFVSNPPFPRQAKEVTSRPWRRSCARSFHNIPSSLERWGLVVSCLNPCQRS